MSGAEPDRFSGARRLYGAEALSRFAAARVAVVGLGGVGSWVVEALARTGVGVGSGGLVLMDLDDVCVTNTNRQVQATAESVGRSKVEAMADRVRSIAPEAEVAGVDAFFGPKLAERLWATSPDVVVDAIDRASGKALLISQAAERGVSVVTVGGAGARREPGLVRTADLSKAFDDSLLAATRKRLRQLYGFPRNPRKRFGVGCVFSPGGDDGLGRGRVWGGGPEAIGLCDGVRVVGGGDGDVWVSRGGVGAGPFAARCGGVITMSGPAVVLHDAHCHFDAYPDPWEALGRCEREGLSAVWVTTTPSRFDHWARQLGTRSLRRVRLVPGLHPQELPAAEGELPRLLELVAGAAWVGEIGLDGVDGSAAAWASQRRVLGAVLERCVGAGQMRKRLSLHGRRASGELLEMLDGGFPRAVLHWFSGADAALERALAEGRWFSVNPSMAGSRRGRQILRELPRDRVVLESDGPYAMCEGRPAMPWDGGGVVRALASLWACPEAEVAGMLTANWSRLSADSEGSNSERNAASG